MAGRRIHVCSWAGSWGNRGDSRTRHFVGYPSPGCSLKTSKGTRGARAGQGRWILSGGSARAGIRLYVGSSEVGEVEDPFSFAPVRLLQFSTKHIH